MRRIVLFVLVQALVGFGLVTEPVIAQSQSQPPVVFAAASLKNALDAIEADWRKESGRRAVISYDASSALARQLEAGAPADIFISADLDWMNWAEQHKLIRTGTRETLLGNALVLIAPADSKAAFKIAPGANLAAALGDSRLAVGEVSSVPAGKYAKEALEKLGMWAGVANKLAPGNDVRAALNFVARGEVRFGIVYATDAHAEPKVRIVDTFPESSHPPILYPAAITVESRNADAVPFLAFLRSPGAVRNFNAQGFTVVAK